MKRLFIGLRFSGIITHGLKDLQGGVNGANWVTVNNLHLTLRFIGECDNSLVNDILLELTKLRSNCFNIQLNGVNHFKNKGRVKSLWVGVVEISNLSFRYSRSVTQSDFIFVLLVSFFSLLISTLILFSISFVMAVFFL